MRDIDGSTIERIAPNAYRVDSGERSETVYVAGSAGVQWAFWNGRVYKLTDQQPRRRTGTGRKDLPQALSSPMPATVRSILVKPGTAVSKGDVLMVLEAMKMELPLRAQASGVVGRVLCREGDLV